MNASFLTGAATLRALLILGFALVALGLSNGEVLAQFSGDRIREALFFFAVTPALAWVLARLTRLDFARALILLLIAVYFGMAGLAPTIATVLTALAAIAIGSLLLPEDAQARPWLALLLGFACLAGALGWLLPYSMHRFGVYLVLCLVPIVARRRVLGALLLELYAWWRAPRLLGFDGTAAVLVIALVATSAWLPTAQPDDLSYHLGLPWQLTTLAHYRFDAESQVWALAPWATDVLQAVVQVLARAEGRGALNLVWLLLVLHLCWAVLARFDVPVRWRWLGLALFASQPLVHGLVQSMQAELPLTATLLALVLLIDECDTPERSRARVLPIAALAGFAIGIKLTAAAFLLPLALWYFWRARPAWPRTLAGGALLVLLTGCSSYVYAYMLTGNPVLPLYNDIFRSSYFGLERMMDAHYTGPLAWTAPYDVVIHTSRFQEARDGSAGFQWLAFLGLALPALAWPRTRAFALAALAAIAILFSQLHYLRYLIPALTLLGLVYVAVLAAGGFGAPLRAALWFLVALNVAALGNTMWNLRDGSLTRIERAKGPYEQAYLAEVAPQRVLARYLRDRYGENVMALALESETFVAELSGRGLVDQWYDPVLRARTFEAKHDDSGDKYLALLREFGVTHVMTRAPDYSIALARVLARVGELEFRSGTAELYRIRPEQAPLAGLPAEWGVWQDEPWVIATPAPAQGALAGEYVVRFQCRPQGAPFATRLNAIVGEAVVQRQLDYQLCPTSGVLQLQGFGRMRGADRVEVRLDPGSPTQSASFAPLGAELTVRPDLGQSRDKARSLRP